MRANFGLQRAIEWATELQRPLLVVDALSLDYPHASLRHFQFVIEGMKDLAEGFAPTAARYLPFVETRAGDTAALLALLARSACVAVTDDYPQRWEQERMRILADACPVRAEAVDSNGLLPLRAAPQAFPTAFAFRRFLQRELPVHLDHFPKLNPLARAALPPLKKLPPGAARFPNALSKRDFSPSFVARSLPVDQSVSAGWQRGGPQAAKRAVQRFMNDKLERYAAERNEPEADVTSNLSAYLHFGHISAFEILSAFARRESWTPEQLSHSTSGSRTGWWRMSDNAEAFLDQLVTWRELGFNFSAHREDYDQFDSLPDWARQTLLKHEKDERPYTYSREQLSNAATHDPLWNAAQTQLVRDGRLHNCLRMLWGKKIIEWTRSPREAAEIMIELNDRYALDGRDPNSYSGIFWCLGRYDRPWGPERSVFGTIRYMSSENTARKVRVRDYIKTYSS